LFIAYHLSKFSYRQEINVLFTTVVAATTAIIARIPIVALMPALIVAVLIVGACTIYRVLVFF